MLGSGRRAAPVLFILPLCTQVPGRGILRTSPKIVYSGDARSTRCLLPWRIHGCRKEGFSVNVQGSLAERNDQAGVPQYRLPMILFMFAWPAAWFMFLIWVVTPVLFGTPARGEFLSTWLFIGIATVGNAAELLVALLVLRREGYRLTLRALRARAQLRWPRGWR